MNKNVSFCIAWILCFILSGCDPNTSEQPQAPEQGVTGDPSRFNGTWEVTGRTGNEDGSNEPICGHETGLGKVTIQASKITGNITNKSGFEYTVAGSIDNRGKIKATLIYQGYDAAELFGVFSAETNSAKGHWKDAVNACPGVWQAVRISNNPTTTPNPAQAEAEPAQPPSQPQPEKTRS